MMDDLPNSGMDGGFTRLFTVDEANEMLPSITPLLLRLKTVKEQFDQMRRTLEAMTPTMRGNGHGTLAIDLERRINDHVSVMSAGTRELAAQGIEVKDLNQGLIDFPHLRDGRVVYLCWRLGERRIGHWHEIDAGFAGRQMLDAGPDPFDLPEFLQG